MTCSIRDNAEQKIWNMVNIYKGLKRRGGKKKPLKIGILGLKSKSFLLCCLQKILALFEKKFTFTQKKKNIWKNGKKKNQCDTLNFVGLDTYLTSVQIIFCLSGCMAERLKHKILDKEKMVDLVCGPDAYRDLPRLLSMTSGSGQSAGQKFSPIMCTLIG